jgi:hypothetical protein
LAYGDVCGVRIALIQRILIIDNRRAEEAIIDALEAADFLKAEHIVYQHSSTPKSWENGLDANGVL